MSDPTDDIASTQYADDPPGIDPHTSDMPPVAEAAERVNAFIKWFDDGRVFVDPEETTAPPLYARDMEALTRLVTRPVEVVTHGTAWEDRLNIICLCGEVCSAVMGKSVAELNRSYVAAPAAEAFAKHLRDQRTRPVQEGS